MTRPPQHSASPRRRARSRSPFRIYDLIVVPTILFGYVEIAFWGARAAALGWLGSLLASPLMLRYEEARRQEQER